MIMELTPDPELENKICHEHTLGLSQIALEGTLAFAVTQTPSAGPRESRTRECLPGVRLTFDFRQIRRGRSIPVSNAFRRGAAMADVRASIPGFLVVARLVASGDALGWSEPRLAQTGLQIATPPSAILVRTADSRTAPDPGGSNDSDEVPDITEHPAASSEGDEVPPALAPRNPEPSSAVPQSATSS